MRTHLLGPARAASLLAAATILAACVGSGGAPSGADGGGGDASVDATTRDVSAGDGAAADVRSIDAAAVDEASADEASADGASADGASASDAAAAVGVPVLQFHNHASRDGVFVDPLLTASAAKKMHLDRTFTATIDGNVYAQPLYVVDGPGGQPAFIVATENNNVYALDENGATIWARRIGAAAARAEVCGNIRPLGITGTPVVDPTRRALYVDAALPGVGTTSMAEHEIHALSLEDGSELAGGWPVKASTVSGVMGADAGTMKFLPNPQNQRGALLILGSTLYVPYGGHSGDCTDSSGAYYRGWVIGVPLDRPGGATGFVTQASQSGIWATGGLATDGTSIFGTTGNAGGGQSCPNPPPVSPPPGWAQQEAILRFRPGPVWSGQTTDYWAPADWPCLDNADLDVGGSSPVVVDLPSGSPRHLVVALGKDGNMYVADRTNLGGVGAPVASLNILSRTIKAAPAAYATPSGTYVVAYGIGGAGVGCPAGQTGNLVAVKITPGTPPTLSTAWCADELGEGAPIFTTSDGTHDNLVWAVGAEASNELRAWDADTGALVYAGTDVLAGSRHFSTVIAVKGRIFSAADSALNAFTSQ